MVQSRYEFPLHYLVSGDFNKVDTTDIMEFNGALNQICSVPTRKSETLELIITDMATLFYQPTTLDPFKQDDDKIGTNSPC